MGLTEKSFLERNEEMGIFKTDCNVKSNQSGDLIRRSAAIDAILGSFSAIRAIEELPAVDAAPVAHGRWRDTGSGQECSVCNEIQYGYDSRRFYCANCGAKMDREE